MEVVVAVIKPQKSVSSFSSREFHPSNYSILLVESKAALHAEWGKPIRSLPMFSLKRDEEPREVILNYLYQMTGEKSDGIKGERALPVRTSRDMLLNYQNNYSAMKLYCVPITHNHNNNIEKSVTANMAFFSLDIVLEGGKNFTCTPTTLTLLFTLKNWLAEKHMQSGSVRCMFRIRAEFRISVCINNPVFIPRSKEQTSADGRNTANFDALTKMLAIEKCDTVVMNPLFGSGLPYKAKTNRVVTNIYWGMGIPDYKEIIAHHQSAMESKLGMDQLWARNYPIHKCAYEGDVNGIMRLSKIPHSMKDDKMFAPIHYAAWKGHADAVVTLLRAGCSPNITNVDHQTPLHIAAMRGKPNVVDVLLEDSNIDVNARNKNNKTPYDLCCKASSPEMKRAADLLEAAMNRPSRKIEIHLMDGKQKTLNLTTGDNTTVSHFREQMLRELDLPESYGNIFSIWICSQSLELQLKLEHKPVHQLHSWKGVVKQLTEKDPEQEKPVLQWRRNAKVNLQEEQLLLSQIQHEVGINLLFQEAYHNYIYGLYPFTDQINYFLAACLMYILGGKQDPNSVKSYCTKNLTKFLPTSKQKVKGNANYILAQYRQLLEDDSLTHTSLKLEFLKKCHTLQIYGSAFFFGTLQERANRFTPYHIGVNGFGIHLINVQAKNFPKSYMYNDISWHYQEFNINLLEIRVKSSTGSVIHLQTKQAGIIYHLMTKLSRKPGSEEQNGIKSIL
ncbi:krev interaction trapped protein 1 [Octopus bimaculoides]|uniref:FERM domain-containing protein n=1 Tax=Octopus bimaculoides TaxID=37653 RepID=A0A0L8H2I1_OCTBM|nr:krev interaction trapped protein 1 [Octopus bimaculoides]XP_014775953.1 krev interaction trapped protein 1 [Octopus bimaculoides]|eukprot:XP_014775952.1 PREDICTED: krev interaction trapped protein 1-like [Octopus bimaculoides]